MPDDEIPDSAHYDEVASDFLDGGVVPFLGAGANLCGQDVATPFATTGRAPLGREVAEALLARLSDAERAELSDAERNDLIKASQFFVLIKEDESRLFAELHKLFRTAFPITPVHDVLASVQIIQRQRQRTESPLLVVTTNYDTVMESAFVAKGIPCDVVAYITHGEYAGRFHHYELTLDASNKPVTNGPRVIENPAKYEEGLHTVSSDDGALNLVRPLVLKLHGHIDVRDSDRDSFVITQDHYIDFLARNQFDRFLPSKIMAHLTRRRFLFLGYSLEDWNLRALLHFIWEQRKRSSTSWAVRHMADDFDRMCWRARKVKTFKLDLKDYMTGLEKALLNVP